MTPQTLNGRCLVPGVAAGPVLHADVALSFMGCVDAVSGEVRDVHHPLLGQHVAGKILAIPSGRGSCSGSLTIFELLMNGHAPRALVFQHRETILTFGSIIAEEFFGRGIPVVNVTADDFAKLATASHARIENGAVSLSDSVAHDEPGRVELPPLELADFTLSERDRQVLAGEFGEAERVALRAVIRMARLEGATGLVDVEMGHIDGCFYQGPGGLQFIERLRSMGAKVRIPTTMNAIKVDRQKWRAQGVAKELGAPSEQLADAYVAMGVKPTYTCAPYLLDVAPRFGQQIAWAESNAVVFANAVLGARTMKYPDYLDILVAITGRAPDADCHRSEGRKAAVRIDLPPLTTVDDSFYALLGYHCGKLATNDIPLICGLEHLAVSRDHLKSFGAAFATTSAMPMFHISGITPEANDAGNPSRIIQVTRHDLVETWRELNTATTSDVDLIALGNPHFSLEEIADLAQVCSGKRKAPHTSLTVTCGRDVYNRAAAAGHVAAVEAFGGKFLNDTCWCFIDEPVVPAAARNIATNSGKYAHYGAAALDRGFHFASMARCVEGARTGQMESALPGWLAD